MSGSSPINGPSYFFHGLTKLSYLPLRVFFKNVENPYGFSGIFLIELLVYPRVSGKLFGTEVSFFRGIGHGTDLRSLGVEKPLY